MKTKTISLLIFSLILLVSCANNEFIEPPNNYYPPTINEEDSLGILYNEQIYLLDDASQYHPEGKLNHLGEVVEALENLENLTSSSTNLSSYNVPVGTSVYMEEIDSILQEHHLIIIYMPESSSYPVFLKLSGSTDKLN